MPFGRSNSPCGCKYDPTVEALNARFPTLELGSPDISCNTGEEFAWAEDGEIAQILARVDSQILDLVEILVSDIRSRGSGPEVAALLARLRRAAGQHGIEVDPIVEATVRFWREMKFSARADLLERLHSLPTTGDEGEVIAPIGARWDRDKNPILAFERQILRDAAGP